MDPVTVGGYDQAFVNALTATGGSAPSTGMDLTAFGVGTGPAPLAVSNDAAYTNQYVNSGQFSNQTNTGTQLLGQANVPATSVTLPPAATTATAPAPAPAPAPAAAPAQPPAPQRATKPETKVVREPVTYTVRSGDSLSKIAAEQGLKNWQELYNHAGNRKVVGSNPNLIRPGQKLTIPGKFTEKTVPVDKPAGADTGQRGGGTNPTPATTPTPPAGNGGAAATTTATTAQPSANVAQLQQQLQQVDQQRAEGARLLTEFYAQLNYAQSVQSRQAIEQSIEQTRQDNYTLDQIRMYIVQQLGPYAPQENPVDSFVQYGLGAGVAANY